MMKKSKVVPCFSEWRKINRELKRMINKAESDHVIYLKMKEHER